MRTSVKCAVFAAGLAWLVVTASSAAAAESPVGTWVRQAEAGRPEETMTIDSWGIGHTKLGTATTQPGFFATIMSSLDGADSPVIANGKATTATVALTLLDAQTATSVTKLDLQPIGASKWTFSPDFETLTIENDFAQAVPGTPAGTSTEHWTRE
jgi:hypothetical protein